MTLKRYHSLKTWNTEFYIKNPNQHILTFENVSNFPANLDFYVCYLFFIYLFIYIFFYHQMLCNVVAFRKTHWFLLMTHCLFQEGEWVDVSGAESTSIYVYGILFSRYVRQCKATLPVKSLE